MSEFSNLHQLLKGLYSDMMPLCSQMATVAQVLAGLGALFFIGSRVWQSLSRAEPIDVSSMMRPFAIGLAIMFFPTIVLGTVNGVMSYVAQGTHSILDAQTVNLNNYRFQRDSLEQKAMLRDPATAYLASDEEFDKKLADLGWAPSDLATMAGMYLERASYDTKRSMRKWFIEILELMFAAAALIIDTVRTFFLIVLSILGPIAFAISVWDGFQSTLTQWFCRYISIYMWLPISDLFSTMLARIQTLLLRNDIYEFQNNASYSIEESNGIYIIFMLIGIFGYFTIPTVASWIIQSGGAGAYGRRLTGAANKVGNIAGAAAGAMAGNITGRLMGK
ncbi:MAG: conjugative transposon protein TraJ [Rikenellaceae bacterium]